MFTINTGQYDQMMESIKDMAKMTASYYKCLVDEGFEPQHALFLTAEFMKTVFKPDGK